MLKVLAVIAGLFVIFIIWMLTSVGRGMRKRDAKLFRQIEPMGRKLDTGEPISQEEVNALAVRPELRHILFQVLRPNRPDLLPTGYSSSVDQGASALAYWMVHPNELQEAPEAIELVETVKRPIDGKEADFHVYRYKMPAGHWAAKDGWILGLAGPMKPEAEPYSELPGAFSRVGDLEGKIKPAELVDWYVNMLRRKGLAKA